MRVGGRGESERMNVRLTRFSDDFDNALDWRVVEPGQIWQAICDPYLCTIVRSPDVTASFYATIVRSGDLAVVVLEATVSLEDAQAWCMRGLGAVD